MSGSGGNYAFHKCDDVLAYLRPRFADYGIDFTHSVVEHECIMETVIRSSGKEASERRTVKMICCTLTNVDDPTQQITANEVGYGIDSQDKGPGKSSSYAIKTFLINKFCLRGNPDEDTLDRYVESITSDQYDDMMKLANESDTDIDKLCVMAKVASGDQLQLMAETRYLTIMNLLRKKAGKK